MNRLCPLLDAHLLGFQKWHYVQQCSPNCFRIHMCFFCYGPFIVLTCTDHTWVEHWNNTVHIGQMTSVSKWFDFCCHYGKYINYPQTFWSTVIECSLSFARYFYSTYSFGYHLPDTSFSIPSFLPLYVLRSKVNI